jgi:hypothetical protein
MVEILQRKITDLEKHQQVLSNAFSSLSKVLSSKTAHGDLSARVGTKGWSEELAAAGIAINTLIETLEFEKRERKRKDRKVRKKEKRKKRKRKCGGA